MTDVITAIITGLSTGIGVYLANYIGEKHLRSKLDKINSSLTEIKRLAKGDK